MEEKRTPPRRFQRVEAWHRAHRLVLDVYEFSNTLPEDEKLGLTAQMRRAAVAVPAAIVDACRCEARQAAAGSLARAEAALEELRYYLMLCRDLGFDCRYGYVEGESERVARLLDGMRRS